MRAANVNSKQWYLAMSENTLYSQIKDEMKQNEEVLTILFEQTLKCIAMIDRITGDKCNKLPMRFENTGGAFKSNAGNFTKKSQGSLQR